MKVISCLIDFTDASRKAISYAVSLAEREKAELNFLHITRDASYNNEELEQKVLDFVQASSLSPKVSVSTGDGYYLEQIPKLLEVSQADFVVIATHGKKGTFQTMVGADVVQLVQKLPISALVVQGHSPDCPDHFKNILFPIGPHDDFQIKTEATAHWAESNGAQVEILCLITDAKRGLPPAIEKNLNATVEYFKQRGIAHTVVQKDSQAYGVGFGKDIVAHAEAGSFDLLSIMTQTSEENMYFGNVDKTEMMLNAQGLPVLCIGG